jgi:hypothetical protein
MDQLRAAYQVALPSVSRGGNVAASAAASTDQKKKPQAKKVGT